MKPKISVIITAYKTEKYLTRCLDSILNQSYKNFQVILVDNASPDSVPEICDDYAKNDSRIIVIHNKNNIGVGNGRNTGLDYLFSHELTEYLVFIDSDDWIHELYFEKLLEVAEKEKVDIVFCSHNRVKNITPPLKFSQSDFIPEKFTDMEDFWVIKMNCLAFCIGRLFKSIIFENIRFPEKGLDDERTTFKAVLSAETVATIPAKLYNYFVNSESYMHSSWTIEKKADQLNSVYEQLEYLYKNGYKKTFLVATDRYFSLVIETSNIFYRNSKYINLFKVLKQNIIYIVLNYGDLISYENAKKLYNSGKKGILQSDYNSAKKEKNGFLPPTLSSHPPV